MLLSRPGVYAGGVVCRKQALSVAGGWHGTAEYGGKQVKWPIVVSTSEHYYYYYFCYNYYNYTTTTTTTVTTTTADCRHRSPPPPVLVLGPAVPSTNTSYLEVGVLLASPEGRLARDHLEEHAGPGPVVYGTRVADVAAARLAVQLLGREVLRGAHLRVEPLESR